MNKRIFLSRCLALGTAGLGLTSSESALGWIGTRMRKRASRSAYQIARDLNLTTGLKLCLDAGDVNSYSSGQIWNDISGSGTNVYLGTDGTVESKDPTFTGHAGNRSQNDYFSFDGGDNFASVAVTPAWMNSFHKDNARFSIIIWAYATGSGSIGFLGNSANGQPGFNVSRSAAGEFLLQVFDNNSTLVRGWTRSGLPGSRWLQLGICMDESVGAAGGWVSYDTSFTNHTSNYSSPTAVDNSNPFAVGARTYTGSTNMDTGSRMAIVMIWDGVRLSQAQVTSLYHALKPRFGL